MPEPSSTPPRKTLREQLQARHMAVAVGAGDALSARLVEQAGFDAVYLSGYAVAGTYGMPDVGLLTQTEMVQRAAQMADSVSIPILADADTGYGNAVNMVRTVREFERAGVQALQIEDQHSPKRCGSMPGKAVVPVHEMCGKIKAAVDTRRSGDLLIVARTDAMAEEGMEAALERLAAYREAGADLVLALGPYDEAGARQVIRRAPGPLVYFNSESFTMPMLPLDVLRELGVAVAIFPLTLALAIPQAVRKVLAAIRRDGTALNIGADDLMSWKDFNQLMGAADIRRIEKDYG